MSDFLLKRNLDKEKLGLLEDWQGNNMALACPVCLKVYIVSGLLHRTGRECPNCGKSRAFVSPDGKIASVQCSQALPSWGSE